MNFTCRSMSCDWSFTVQWPSLWTHLQIPTAFWLCPCVRWAGRRAADWLRPPGCWGQGGDGDAAEPPRKRCCHGCMLHAEVSSPHGLIHEANENTSKDCTENPRSTLRTITISITEVATGHFKPTVQHTCKQKESYEPLPMYMKSLWKKKPEN